MGTMTITRGRALVNRARRPLPVKIIQCSSTSWVDDDAVLNNSLLQTFGVSGYQELWDTLGDGGSVNSYLNAMGRIYVTLPFAPLEVDYGGFGLEYDTIERPGLKPLLEPTTRKLRTLSFTAKIADKRSKGTVSVEDALRKLTVLANRNEDCLFIYGAKALPFRVRITSLSYSSIRRNLLGHITQADVSIELQERVTVNRSIVALNAIEYEPPVRPGEGGGSGENGGNPSDPCSLQGAAAVAYWHNRQPGRYEACGPSTWGIPDPCHQTECFPPSIPT